MIDKNDASVQRGHAVIAPMTASWISCGAFDYSDPSSPEMPAILGFPGRHAE
jgi:hypothetical protein